MVLWIRWLAQFGGFVILILKILLILLLKKLISTLQIRVTAFCIVDTKGSHADLTDDYSAIPKEMKEVDMLYLGKNF